MVDEERLPNETGVTENNYASMLGEAIKQKDAEIAAIKEAAAARTKELTSMIVNGQQQEAQAQTVEVVKTREELYKEFQKMPNDTCNLDFWKNFIELRNATIRENGKDPCVTGSFGSGPNGTVRPSYGEAEEIQETMDTIQQLIDECEGDAELFRVKFASKFR